MKWPIWEKQGGPLRKEEAPEQERNYTRCPPRGIERFPRIPVYSEIHKALVFLDLERYNQCLMYEMEENAVFQRLTRC